MAVNTCVYTNKPGEAYALSTDNNKNNKMTKNLSLVLIKHSPTRCKSENNSNAKRRHTKKWYYVHTNNNNNN